MKKLLIIISVFMVFSACSKLEDLNKNTKDFTVVPGEALYNGATRALINQLHTCNVNSNNTMLFVQHWAETTYPDESRYDMVTRPIPANHMNTMYRNVLMNYKEAVKAFDALPILEGTPTTEAQKKQRANELAIIEVMSVLAWSNLVETYGDMPYSEALDISNPAPKYDDALTIYKDLISRLDAAIGKMDVSAIGMPGSGATAHDNIFCTTTTTGSTAKWKKFANTLKLRMGIMLADVDAAYAKTVVESAAPNVFVSGDKAALTYLASSPNQNPLYTELVASGRSDFVVTSVLIDAMQPTSPTPAHSVLSVTVTDPRLAFYATKTGDPAVYKGGKQGSPNSYNSFSHVLNATAATTTTPVVIMDYAEAEFLLAEAVERGFAVGGTAETHYNNAVTASITSWGATAAQAAAYLAQPTVAYTTAVGTWKQKIGTQAWLAYWLRGMTNWTTFRRLDYPILTAPAGHVEGIDKVPTRYTFAVSEQTLNGANYTAAAAKIGGDTPLTKIFWDKY
jgi:hypothetical protein